MKITNTPILSSTDVPPELSSVSIESPASFRRVGHMKKRFTEPQSVGFLREVDAGVPVKELCRKHGFSEAGYDLWRSTIGGMNVSDAKRQKELEIENTRLKKLLADALLENEVTREVLRNNWRPRQAGVVVNHKRVDRVYTETRRQVRRRRRKNVLPADRQPLARPQIGHEVWSADFVFDRTAEGRVLTYLTIVDDATTEAVAIVAARALGGLPLTRILVQRALERGLPKALRTDNGPACCGRARRTWAHDRGVTVRLIEPGTLNQHADIEAFHGRVRDECVNEHWCTSLGHGHVVIETWRRAYNEERPKNSLGGLTPALYAGTLAAERSIVTAGL